MTPGYPETVYITADAADRATVTAAESLIVLTGGFEGTRNFGDILQTRAALQRVLTNRPEAVVAVLGDGQYSTDELRSIGLDGAAILRYHVEPPDPRECVTAVRAMTMVYLTGGGYLNRHWGNLKLAQVEALDALARSGGGAGLHRVAASGLQISDHPDLWRWAGWLNSCEPLLVRDAESIDVLAALGVERPASNLGDDAYAELTALEIADLGPNCVNLHVNTEPYSTSEPDARVAWMLDALAGLAGKIDALRCQLLVAFDDTRIGESAAADALITGYRQRADREGLPPIEFEAVVVPRLVADGVPIPLGSLGTISGSYHISLLSLLNGVPAMLLADNDYYEQKMNELAGVFDLGSNAVVRSQAAVDSLTSFDEIGHRLANARPAWERLIEARVTAARFAIGQAVTALARDAHWDRLTSVLPTYREAVEESTAMHRRIDLASEVLLDAQRARNRQLESLTAELAVLRAKIDNPPA